MIFAYATDEKTLMVFSNERDAISYCEGWDVSEGSWLFFAADGSPMEAAFSEPASKSGWVISHGRYSLRPIAHLKKHNCLHSCHSLPQLEVKLRSTQLQQSRASNITLNRDGSKRASPARCRPLASTLGLHETSIGLIDNILCEPVCTGRRNKLPQRNITQW